MAYKKVSWCCEYCGDSFDSKECTKIHEKSCCENPKLKLCYSCALWSSGKCPRWDFYKVGISLGIEDMYPCTYWVNVFE